jgi:hypothetical protein
MGERLRGLIVLGVVLAAGIFIGSAVSQWSPSPQREIVSSPPQNSTAAGLGRVRVEVLNAGGREDMARLATDHLRDRGFDVVYFGNAETFGQDSTLVIDRAERPRAAAAVGRALGTHWVESEPDANLYLDVTVLLGSGWLPGMSGEEGERDDSGEAGGIPWWDVRRFLR